MFKKTYKVNVVENIDNIFDQLEELSCLISDS